MTNMEKAIAWKNKRVFFGDSIELDLYNENVYLLRWETDEESIVIPEFIYKVCENAIGFERKNIKHVVVEDGVQSLGVKSFYKSIISIDIPESVEILEGALGPTTNIETMTLRGKKVLRERAINGFLEPRIIDINGTENIEFVTAHAITNCATIRRIDLSNAKVDTLGIVHTHIDTLVLGSNTVVNQGAIAQCTIGNLVIKDAKCKTAFKIIRNIKRGEIYNYRDIGKCLIGGVFLNSEINKIIVQYTDRIKGKCSIVMKIHYPDIKMSFKITVRNFCISLRNLIKFYFTKNSTLKVKYTYRGDKDEFLLRNTG